MNTSHLTTILIVNFNSSDFILNTLWCLKRITKNPYRVIVADNGSMLDDYKKLELRCSTEKNVKCYRKENFTLRGSIAHGTTLNELVKMVDTPYFSILDADATWLAKDWDQILIDRLNESVKVIGTQAPASKPQDFPLMFCILFETDTFQKLGIDFRPKDIEQRQDTGYELREKYMSAGFEGGVIEMKNTRSFKKGPFRSLVGIAEYYLDQDYDHIFASHFGRGSSLGANKYQKGLIGRLYALPVIGPYLLKKKGIREKREWIDACKTIVNGYERN
jgi:glycosyltransferase involved in cell wall biosynthesis